MPFVAPKEQHAQDAGRPLSATLPPEDAQEEAWGLCRLTGLRPGATVLIVNADGGGYAGTLAQMGHRIVRLGDRCPPPTCDLVLDVPSFFGSLGSQEAEVRRLMDWRARLSPQGWLVMKISVPGPKGPANRTEGGVPSGRFLWLPQARPGAKELPQPRESTRSAYLLAQTITVLHAAGFGFLQIYGSLCGRPKKPHDPLAVLAQNW